MDSGLNARNSKSGPMGDNQGYTDDRNAFMVPILNRPLQYQVLSLRTPRNLSFKS